MAKPSHPVEEVWVSLEQLREEPVGLLGVAPLPLLGVQRPDHRLGGRGGEAGLGGGGGGVGEHVGLVVDGPGGGGASQISFPCSWYFTRENLRGLLLVFWNIVVS